MKARVVRGGGFAGLVSTTTVDSERLAPADAEALPAKVEESGLRGMPERVAGATTHPDAFDYEVTVEDDTGSKRVTFTEDALPDSVRSLIAWLDSVPGREEHVGPPGG